VPVSTSDSAADVAANLVATLAKGYRWRSRLVKFPFTAAVGAAGSETVVTLTARHAGAHGNSLRVAVGLMAGDDPLARQCLTIGSFTGGTGTVDLGSKLALLGDAPFDTVVSIFNDSDAIADLSAWLEARESYTEQLYGHGITVKYGSYADLAADGVTRNSKFVTVVGVKPSIDPIWRLAAEVGAMVGNHFDSANTRARGMKGLSLVCRAVDESDGLDFLERDQLLRAGIATLTVDPNRRFHIDRLITSYRLDENGVPDETWLDLATRYRSIFAVRQIASMLRLHYSRRAYEQDEGTTRRAMRADIAHRYHEMAKAGILARETAAINQLVIEADGEDRINVGLSLFVQSDLHVIAVNATVGVA